MVSCRVSAVIIINKMTAKEQHGAVSDVKLQGPRHPSEVTATAVLERPAARRAKIASFATEPKSGVAYICQQGGLFLSLAAM
jgi:hypothetical protein